MLWFEIAEMLIAVFKNKFVVSFIIIFGRLSFPIRCAAVFTLSTPRCTFTVRRRIQIIVVFMRRACRQPSPARVKLYSQPLSTGSACVRCSTHTVTPLRRRMSAARRILLRFSTPPTTVPIVVRWSVSHHGGAF